MDSTLYQLSTRGRLISGAGHQVSLVYISSLLSIMSKMVQAQSFDEKLGTGICEDCSSQGQLYAMGSITIMLQIFQYLVEVRTKRQPVECILLFFPPANLDFVASYHCLSQWSIVNAW